jgi:hypothetical protein
MASSGRRAEASTPVEVRVSTTQPQRRLTVLFRWILVIPQVIVLYFVGIGAFVVVILGWFAALFTGRLPDSFARFLTGYVRWSSRVQAYAFLLTDRYPPFALDPDPNYPVDVTVTTGRLNRASVFFRFILVIPAAFVVDLLIYGLLFLSPIIWIITLVAGRLPDTLFGAIAAVVRYQARYTGFSMMLTSEYPGDIFGDRGPDGRRLEGAVSGTLEAQPPPPPPPAPGTWGPGQTPAWGAQEGTSAPAPPPPPTGAPPSASGASATPPPPPQSPPAPSPFSQFPSVPPPPPPPGWAPQGPSAPEPPGPMPPDYGGPVWAAGSAPRLWLLVLTKAARTMTAVLLVLGAVGIVAYALVVPHLFKFTSIEASIDSELVSTDYTLLTTAEQTFTTATQACSGTAAAGQLACFQSADSAWAQALRTYGSQLGDIGMPSSAQPEAMAAIDAADGAASAYQGLASANAQSYAAASTSPAVTTSFQTVQRTYNDLINALAAA